MKEQSQIDEMRAAIRGDLERSRARQRASPVVEPEAEAEQEPPAQDRPRPGILSSFFKRR